MICESGTRFKPAKRAARVTENRVRKNRVTETQVMKNRSLVYGMVTLERHIAGGRGEDGDWP